MATMATATTALPAAAHALDASRPRMLRQFELGHTLGAGLQGKVKLALDTTTQQRVALKILDAAKLTRKALLNLYREVEAMQRVQHANVLRLLSVVDDVPYTKKNGTTTRVVLIVLELAPGGELFDFMMYTGSFQETIARTYFQHLVQGLQACHTQGVFHRDIKPENLLLDADFTLKIADFGLSALRARDDGALEELYTQCGTRSYMSPEVLSGMPYQGAPADVWAAGVVLFIMLAGFPPFQIATRQDWWFRACAARQYEAFWAAHGRSATFSPGAQALLTRIFAVDPAERITLEQIQQDEWFNASALDANAFRAELETRKLQVDEEKRREREEKQRQQQQNGKHLSDSFDPFDKPVERSISALLEQVGLDDADAPIAPLYPKGTVTLYTCFRSKKTPFEVQKRVERALGDVSAHFETKQDHFKIKAEMKERGVAFAVRIYALAKGPGRCMVEFRRTSGDCFQFRDVYTQLSSKLADLIWDGQEDDAAGVADASEDIISDEARMI